MKRYTRSFKECQRKSSCDSFDKLPSACV